MGQRPTKIVTRMGDRGETRLVGNLRVSKDSPRLWAVGTVDELNSALGLARALCSERRVKTVLTRIQHELFRLGAELATPPQYFKKGMPQIQRRHVLAAEKALGSLQAEIPPLTEFILPGGCPAAAALHLARAICRRAERYCVRLAREEAVGQYVIPYLNRLGDLLFVLARYVNRQQGALEMRWRK